MPHTFNTTVPHLQTERLILREYRREDFDAFAAHLMDPDSAAHLDRADRPTAWRIFLSHSGLWLIDGAGWWSVEDRRSGQVVGSVGAFFREDASVMEMGWNTYRAFRGQGYAGEAAAAAMAHAFDTRGAPTVRALIAASNLGSQGVAARLGMRHEGETAFNGKPIGVYALQR